MSALGQGSTVAGKYRLERLIGRGGMGSVWAARHIQLDTLVAVKFIDAVADMGDARIRFEREARAAAQLRSPHVVQILDHGIDEDEHPYIAMELLEGEDLGERLRRTPRLSLPATATIITQASKALRRAHEHGVIHRDLKPGNIFLARFDDDEVVKLLDFGVAKLRYGEIAPGVQMTQTGVIFGSPSYMSPEQARGNRVIDHRTDLWSLAVILFRCLTGSKPFEAGSIGDLVIKLCIDPLPMPTRFAADLPPEVDQFFERAFARDPDQRFQSAMALAAEFEAIVARARASVSIPPPQALPQAPPSIRDASAAPSPAHPSFAPPSGATPAPPFTAPRIEATSTPLPPSAPTFQPFPVALPAELPVIAPQPASMTPAPALLPMGAFGAAAPARHGLIAAASLGAGAFFLLAIVIGVALHRRASSAPARTTEATESASSSAIVAPIAPPPTASAVALPPALTADEPAASAPEPEPAASAAPSASASGRKPGPGKAGRGRTPNFGY
jgi:serine/threonine-protein kinase